MNELLHTILLRVTLAGAASAAALRLSGEGAMREVVRLAAGLLMLTALLQPLGSLHLPDLGETNVPDTEALRETNMQTAVQLRAGREGFDCTLSVTMATDENGVLQADRVTVYCGTGDLARIDRLQTLITEECGVPPERQEVIIR